VPPSRRTPPARGRGRARSRSALDRADDLRDGDLAGRAREPVAALDAALAADDAREAQVGEDVLEELQGDLLRLRDPLAA
jgi:hypothetical protein